MIIEDGVLTRVSKKDVDEKGRFKVPKNVTKIGDGAFSFCSPLIKLTIPSSVTSIGDFAFEYCDKLEEIAMSDEITSIGRSAFYKCKNLLKLELPESITSIEKDTFIGCSKLAKIKIPDDVTTIEEQAFFDCSKLKKIDIPGSVKTIENFAFGNCKNLKEITMSGDQKTIAKTAFDIKYNTVKYDASKNKISLHFDSILSGNSIYIPKLYILNLLENGEFEDFMKNSDFRAFNAYVPNFYEKISKFSEEEQLNFFKFFVSIGSFSKKEIDDKKYKTLGKKASAIINKLIKLDKFKISKYKNLFEAMPMDYVADEKFLDFIEPKGKKIENLQLLLNMEKKYPGIFIKAMGNFSEIKEYKQDEESWEDALKKYYIEHKYIGVTEKTRDIARVYESEGLEQSSFDRGVELRKEAELRNIPEHILGKELKEGSILDQIEQLKNKTATEIGDAKNLIVDLYKKNFTYEWLSKNDPRNSILGLYLDCNANIASQQYRTNMAECSVIQKDVQNLVIKDISGTIIANGTVYVNEEYGYAVFNDFELSKRYRNEETAGNELDQEKQEVSPEEAKKAEDRKLILEALERGITAFVSEYDKQHVGKPLQQINIGMGYDKLKENAKKAEELLSVPEEYSFQDAEETQYVLYKRKELSKDDMERE